MSVKPEFASPGAAEENVLRGWSVATAEGPDSAAFLHSQLSSDVLSLPAGQAHWSAWLNPKGRVLALILLLRSDEQRFDLLLPDHPAPALAEQLARFILRRKASIAAQSGKYLRAGIDSPPPSGALRLGGSTPRWLAPTVGSHAPSENEAFESRWRLLDLACGLPRLGAEGGSHTAHMLSLDRLAAFSLGKGCYPGQEIVARTHYLGQSKRGLVCLRMEAVTCPQTGDPIESRGAQVGEVLAAVGQPVGGWRVQAVAAGLQPGEICTVHGNPAEVLALEPPPLPMA
jgi:folate-binding protein YgfZ